jgi:hypothetical protein
MNTTTAIRIPGRLTPAQHSIVGIVSASDPNAVDQLTTSVAVVYKHQFIEALRHLLDDTDKFDPSVAASAAKLLDKVAAVELPDVTVDEHVADAKPAESQPEPEPDADDVEVLDYDIMSRTAVLTLARAEHAEMRAWQRHGAIPDERPDTPALDYLAQDDAATRKARAAKANRVGSDGRRGRRCDDDTIADWLDAKLAEDGCPHGVNALLDLLRADGLSASKPHFKELIEAARARRS